MMPEARVPVSAGGSNVAGEPAPVAGRSDGAAPDGAGPGGDGDGAVGPGAAGVPSLALGSAKFGAAARAPSVTGSVFVLPSRTMVIVIAVPAGRFATAS